MNFFSFARRPLSGWIPCTICGQKGHRFEVSLKRHILCNRSEHYGHYLGKCPMKKLTPSERGMWLFKRQVIDNTLNQAMGRCSLNGLPTNPRPGNNSQPFVQMLEPRQLCDQPLSPSSLYVLFSAIRKSSYPSSIHTNRRGYGCKEKGTYVSSSTQKCLDWSVTAIPPPRRSNTRAIFSL
jgi:hypothetical protein